MHYVFEVANMWRSLDRGLEAIFRQSSSQQACNTWRSQISSGWLVLIYLKCCVREYVSAYSVYLYVRPVELEDRGRSTWAYCRRIKDRQARQNSKCPIDSSFV
jgi:hypothetical protein